MQYPFAKPLQKELNQFLSLLQKKDFPIENTNISLNNPENRLISSTIECDISLIEQKLKDVKTKPLQDQETILEKIHLLDKKAKKVQVYNNGRPNELELDINKVKILLDKFTKEFNQIITETRSF